MRQKEISEHETNQVGFCVKIQNPTKIPISCDYIVTQFLVTQVSLLCYTFLPLPLRRNFIRKVGKVLGDGINHPAMNGEHFAFVPKQDAK